MKFSILIPAYKSNYLEEAIDSCISQTYENFEIIIVDDCSPNNIKSIADKYSDSRIHYYKNSQNCGAINVVYNWNKCLSYAKGEYAICMGDDDRLTQNCLQEYFNLIKKYPGLGVYHALTELIDERGQNILVLEKRPEYETALAFLHRRVCTGCRQFIGDFLFDIKELRRVGGFINFPVAWASDDISAFRAALIKGIANTQTVCFQYRENRHSISSNGYITHKLTAKSMEEEWYYSNINESIISNFEDKKLYNDIKGKIHIYINTEKENLVYSALCNSVLSFIPLLISSNNLKINKITLFKLVCRVIKQKIYENSVRKLPVSLIQ